ncbi:MAG: BMP family ABC transporter substrate-binding protein [Lachnospirales bacterium]
MKKLYGAIIIAMLSFTLVSCGGKSEAAENTEEKGTLKAALLIENLGDMSFNDSANKGMEMASKDFGFDLKVIEYQSVDKAESTFIDTADSDYDVIIVNPSFTTVLEKYAEGYVDKKFILFDDSVDYEVGDMSNVYSIIYSANESSFLVGYLGARMSDSGILAFLGGVENPIINDFLVGFIGGAIEANPDVKVTSTYVGDWQDSAKGKDLTLSMFNQGADIGFAAAGQAGIGLIEAAVDEGKYVFGVDLDQYELFKSQENEEMANVIVSSAMKNVDKSLYRAMELYFENGLEFGKAEILGIKEDGVGLADNQYYNDIVPEDIRNDVKVLEEKIINGDITINSAYGKTAEEVAEIKNAVKP